jgi:hypothetical protein
LIGARPTRPVPPPQSIVGFAHKSLAPIVMLMLAMSHAVAGAVRS